MSLQRRLHVLLARSPETDTERGTVLHRLRSPLGTRREEGMGRVPEEQDPALPAHPCRQRVSVDELPVHEGGGLLHDRPAGWVPSVEHFQDFVEFAGEGP